MRVNSKYLPLFKAGADVMNDGEVQAYSMLIQHFINSSFIIKTDAVHLNYGAADFSQRLLTGKL